LVAGGIFIFLLRNEELKVNLSVIEKTAKIFETIVYDKHLESHSISRFIASSDDINESVKKNEYDSLREEIKKYAEEYRFEDIIIYDKSCKILYKYNNSKEDYPLYCHLSANTDVIFYYDRIFFDTVVPVFLKNKVYYIYTRLPFKKNEVKELLVKDINFSIIEKISGIRVFSTFEEPLEESNLIKTVGKSTKIKTLKKKFYYKYFAFNTNAKMKNFLMEVIVSPEFYRVRIDKLGYLSIALFILWIFATIFFFLVTNNLLVLPIKKIIFVADDIIRGNYKMRLDIKHKNEIGTLARKFNTMANSLLLKEVQINNINKKLETQIKERTKNLQTTMDKLRNYDNQKSDMFYTVIHDLKNPMTVISGYADVLLQYKNFTEEKRTDILKKISNEIDRLTNMLNDFLKNIREENSLSDMELKEVDIVEILEYFYTIYEIQANERLIDFVWNVRAPLPSINGNKEKLQHVLSNLLSNAFKFTPERGMIKISAQIEENKIKVSISDTGPGILEGKEKEIFEKFKKYSVNTNENSQGSGLGLYIVSQIIKKHNGDIWVTNNQIGNGCSFHFTIPILNSN